MKSHRGLHAVLYISIILLFISATVLIVDYVKVDTDPIREQYKSATNNNYDYTIPDTEIAEVIFTLDEESGKLENAVCEILNNRRGSISFVNIPVSMSYTMSTELYNDLKLSKVTLPQTVKVSELYNYYRDKKAYKFITRIIGEIFGCNSEYYVEMDKELFDKIFSYNGGKFSVNRDMISELFLEEGDNRGIIELIKNATGFVNTNWTLEDRLIYLNTYDLQRKKDLLVYSMPGEEKNEGFVPDMEELHRIGL